MPVPVGGSTNWPFGPPNVWITPTAGFEVSPTGAIAIVISPPSVSSVVPEGAEIELSAAAELPDAEPPAAPELADVEPLAAVPELLAELSVLDVQAATSRITIPVAASLPRVDLFMRWSPMFAWMFRRR